MQEEESEFTEFLRDVAAQTRSQSLSEAADRLTARRQVARELEPLASEGIRVLEEMSVAVTPGAMPSRLVFDFTVVSRDIEVGVVLVPVVEGGRVLSRTVVEASREACSATPPIVGVVFVWMEKGLPATGMDSGQLEECLAGTTSVTIAVPQTKLNRVREVVASVLADQIRDLPVPRTRKEEEPARPSKLGVVSVFGGAVRRELEAIRKKRYQRAERREAAERIGEEDGQRLTALFEALVSAEEVEEEQLRKHVVELAARPLSGDASKEGGQR